MTMKSIPQNAMAQHRAHEEAMWALMQTVDDVAEDAARYSARKAA